MAEIFEDIDVDFIISSSYRRAIQTVEYLANKRNLSIIKFEELRERPIKGLDYRLPWDEMVKAIEKSFDDMDYSLRGGQSTRKAQERSIPIIKKLLNEYNGKSIVIGTHRNIMTIIMNYYNKECGFNFGNSISMPDIGKDLVIGKAL